MEVKINREIREYTEAMYLSLKIPQNCKKSKKPPRVLAKVQERRAG